MDAQIADGAGAGGRGDRRVAPRSSASAWATSCWRSRAGAQTHRLPVGHHGGNHAVLEASSGRVDIGAHNHEVAVVDGPALSAAGYAVSHRDLNDGTVEGLVHRSGRIASVQFHPEGAPGPIDAARVFDLAVERALA